MTDFLQRNIATVDSFLKSTRKSNRWIPYMEAVAQMEKWYVP